MLLWPTGHYSALGDVWSASILAGEESRDELEQDTEIQRDARGEYSTNKMPLRVGSRSCGQPATHAELMPNACRGRYNVATARACKLFARSKTENGDGGGYVHLTTSVPLFPAAYPSSSDSGTCAFTAISPPRSESVPVIPPTGTEVVKRSSPGGVLGAKNGDREHAANEPDPFSAG